jgi:hypothetical protein
MNVNLGRGFVTHQRCIHNSPSSIAYKLVSFDSAARHVPGTPRPSRPRREAAASRRCRDGRAGGGRLTTTRRFRRDAAASRRCRDGRAGGGRLTTTRRFRRDAAAEGCEQRVEKRKTPLVEGRGSEWRAERDSHSPRSSGSWIWPRAEGRRRPRAIRWFRRDAAPPRRRNALKKEQPARWQAGEIRWRAERDSNP